MPNVKSAEKRMETNLKSRLRNRAQKAALKTHLKQVSALVEAKNIEALKKTAHQTVRLIGKAGRKRLISRRRAARLQSRLQRKLNQALASSSPPTPAQPT